MGDYPKEYFETPSVKNVLNSSYVHLHNPRQQKLNKSLFSTQKESRRQSRVKRKRQSSILSSDKVNYLGY